MLILLNFTYYTWSVNPYLETEHILTINSFVFYLRLVVIPYFLPYLRQYILKWHNALYFLSFLRNLCWLEVLKVFIMWEWVKEYGWKADLSPALTDYKKVINQNRWDQRLCFSHAVTCKVSVCIDPIHLTVFTVHILLQWLVLSIISPLCDKLRQFHVE